MRIRLLYIMLLFAVCVQAQTDRRSIRQGNSLYRKQQWAQAEVDYRKALAANGNNPQALYNLGCALMQQKKDSAAIEMYMKAGKVETNKLRRSKVFHNIGEVCQRNKMYADAINAYAQALRDNPTDNETRYNLALCQWLNKKNPQQQNQDKNKQNQDKEQQKDKDKNKDKDKEKQQQQPEPKDKMSKDNAEQLLNAAIQNEKATQQRMKQAMQQPQRRNIEKNW